MPDIPFSDFGIQWFEDIVEKITEWFVQELVTGYESFVLGLFDTPLPEGQGTSIIFSQPSESDELWRGIYDTTVAGETMVFALIILFLCVQGRHFIRIFNFGSAYEARKARRSSWTGAFLIITWYWVAVLYLYFVQALTIGLLPDLERLGMSLVNLLPQAAGTPGLTLVMAIIGGLSMVALQAVFFIREVLIYVFLYGMPFGVAIAYGNIPVLSGIAKRLAVQFIPLVALPLPAAVLFRGYEFLFVGDTQLPVESDFLQYLVVISLPLLALYATWKTFRYASPLVANAISRTGRGALIAGSAATAGYVAGPKAAVLATRWGPKAAVSSAVAGTHRPRQTGNERSQSQRPSYRRTENDPRR